MSDIDKKEKFNTSSTDEYEKGAGTDARQVVVPHGEGLYDPTKESRWTRLGLTFESFKRAPGTTG